MRLRKIRVTSKKILQALLVSTALASLMLLALIGIAIRLEKNGSRMKGAVSEKVNEHIIEIKEFISPNSAQVDGERIEPDASNRELDDFGDDKAVMTYGDPMNCAIWPIQDIKVFDTPERAAEIGSVKAGQALCVLDAQEDCFEVSFDEVHHTGYIDNRFCMINLTEYLGDLCEYDITNSYASLFKIHEYDLPDITGTIIPGFEGICLDREKGNYLVPFLYPCAQKLLPIAEEVQEDGYVLRIYEAFRPHKATRYLYDSVQALLEESLPDAEEEERVMSETELAVINEERRTESLLAAQEFILNQGLDPSGAEAISIVQYYLDQTEFVNEGTYIYRKTYKEEMTNNQYKLSAFLAKQISAHNRGIALDLTLRNKETNEDLRMQSDMHDLSYHSVIAANNENAALLAEYMKNGGFNGLSSEWWHFQDDDTRNEIGLSSYLEEGVSMDGIDMAGR